MDRIVGFPDNGFRGTRNRLQDLQVTQRFNHMPNALAPSRKISGIRFGQGALVIRDAFPFFPLDKGMENEP